MLVSEVYLYTSTYTIDKKALTNSLKGLVSKLTVTGLTL
jgi:hypothetical protein